MGFFIYQNHRQAKLKLWAIVTLHNRGHDEIITLCMGIDHIIDFWRYKHNRKVFIKNTLYLTWNLILYIDIGQLKFHADVIIQFSISLPALTQDPLRSIPFLAIIPSIKSGVAINNMAASRTAEVTVCSGSFLFSLSNSGLSFVRTGIARLAEGDNLSKKRTKRGRNFDFYEADVRRRAQVSKKI